MASTNDEKKHAARKFCSIRKSMALATGKQIMKFEAASWAVASGINYPDGHTE
jgi:hypothetical protein